MMKQEVATPEMKRLVDDLWKQYPKGFVANIKKGEVPQRCRGLAQYLAKYLASPPISIGRIIHYDGESVRYWYKDHHSNQEADDTLQRINGESSFYPPSVPSQSAKHFQSTSSVF